jgi:para-nitrobenzyl esterase
MKFTPFSFVIAAAAAVMPMVGHAQQGLSPVVSTKDGRVAGAVRNGTEQFLGIPYAAPPVGELRWAPPALPKPWTDIRQATAYASKCPQNNWTPPFGTYRTEDCLYLNVFRPAGSRSKSALKPVMFWIHGGASVTGSSQDVDPTLLAAKHDIVVVTTNYRLGALGFAAVRQLHEADPNGPAGNFALLDLQQALRWVQANVASFGGDPGDVTLVGRSAGAHATWNLLVSPASEGLFHAAVAMSGTPPQRSRTLEEEQKSGPSSKLVGALGCGTAADVPACMRSKSVDDVYDAGGGLFTRQSGWGAIVDGRIIPEQPRKLFKEGAFHKVPILSGVVHRDAGFVLQTRLVQGHAQWSPKDFDRYLSGASNSGELKGAYSVDKYPSPDLAWVAAESDKGTCQALTLARATGEHTPSYFYDINDPEAPSTIYDTPLAPRGAYHSSDVPYLFQRGFPNELKPNAPQWTPEQLKLSDRLQATVVSFIRTRSPARGGDWPTAPAGAKYLTPAGDTDVPLKAYSDEHNCQLFQ